MNTIFPNIKSLKLLMKDTDIYETAKYLEEHCDWELGQLEIHHINPDFISLGINRICVTFAHSLVSLKLTILDRISWHSIAVIGKYCTELKIFHLEIWDRLMTSNDETWGNVDLGGSYPKLEDLKLKFEDYSDPMAEFVPSYFLRNNCSTLKIVQLIAHLSWLDDVKFQNLWSDNNKKRYNFDLF